MKNLIELHPLNLQLDSLLDKTLQSLDDGIVLIDREGIVKYYNQAARSQLRRQSGRLVEIGKNFLDGVLPERQQIARASIQDAFNGHSSVHKLLYPQEGLDAWIELSYSPVIEEDGQVSHVCVRAKPITEQMILEKKLEAHNKMQRNAILKAALDAQEKQRAEIGRELHDNVNQVLTTVKLYNEICLSEAQPDRNMLLRSVQQINYCIETLRGLSKTLAPPSREEAGLKENIKELTESIDATRKIAVRFYSYGLKNELIGQELQTTIYRIAQEQLTNVLKYAEASWVDVVLVGTSESIALSIQDNGIGFNWNEKRKGVGITNMISRSEAWGGEIEFRTSPGEGCRMMVEFPL